MVIRVGAAADRSLETVMNPLIQAMGRAKARVQADSAAMAGTAARDASKAAAVKAKQVAAEEAAIAKGIARIGAMRDQAAAAEMKADAKAFDQKLKNAQKLQAAREAYIKTVQREIAAEERGQAGARAAGARMQTQRGREAARGAGGVARDAYGTAVGLGRAGLRVGGQVARGMGVDLDIGSQIAGSIALHQRLKDLSNAGYMPGKAGAAGVLQDTGAIGGDVKAASDKWGYSREAGVEGLQAFVAKSGNLELGRKVLGDMAQLARATGSELNEVMGAAGELGAALENSKDPAGDMLNIMRALAGQGKIGAVEMSDQVKYLGRLAATGPQFEGNVASNIQTMGMLTQLARQRGGAASAAEAFTSVSAFTTGFKKNARRSAFAAEGVDIEGAGGMLRDPLAIVKDAIFKTGGDQGRLNKMFMDVRQAKPMDALRNVYMGAGGGKAGEAAVEAELLRLKAATLDQTEVARASTDAMKETPQKVQQFNNKMQDVADKMMVRMLPALERAAPALESLAETAAKVAAVTVENPGAAILAVIIASIAKAAIGQAVGNALAASIAANGGIGAALMAGGPLAIAALAITAASVALYTGLEAGLEKKEQYDTNFIDEDAGRLNAISAARGMRGRPENDPERIAAENELRAQAAALQAKLDLAKGPDVGLTDVLFGDKGWSSGRDQVNTRENFEGLQREMAMILALLGGGLEVKGNVTVDNIADAKSPLSSPTVDNASRENNMSSE
ncbi:MAG: hypothetical protein WKG00_03305 [Polyangiaceae bacterium]